MEKKVEISMLWQIYGKLLTEKQNQLIDYYYNNDLSLSEIAENENITRQAVRDIIKKGERKLFEYEEKLLFMRKTINQEKQIVMKTDNRSLFAYSSRLQEITRKLRGKARITESDLKEMLREVKLALLEADVNYKIVKEFIASIQEKALGQDVIKSLTPGQQVIKIVKDEMVELLGGTESKKQN